MPSGELLDIAVKAVKLASDITKWPTTVQTKIIVLTVVVVASVSWVAWKSWRGGGFETV